MTGTDRLIRALGESCVHSERWRESTSGSRGGEPVRCTVTYRCEPDDAPPPGTFGVTVTLDTWGTGWRARPSTSQLSADQSAFWQALADRGSGRSGFDGFALSTAELLAVLPHTVRDAVLDALRARAADRERQAFELTADAKALREAVGRRDTSWACPHKTARQHYESADGTLQVVRLAAATERAPAGSWQVLGLRFGRLRPQGDWPYWWPTRRAADDVARQLLDAAPDTAPLRP